jgi:hypothetical protein
MRVGSLVKWSKEWLVGCRYYNTLSELEEISNQVGIVTEKSSTYEYCWIVAWTGGRLDDVHPDYLDIMCE